jgi:lauroyl/myristoyl acyltransferase
MSEDNLVTAARALLDLGPDAFSGPLTDAFVEEVGRQHPAGALYKSATAKAIRQRELIGISPEEAANGVFRNFIWTHFVCKLIMTASPAQAVDFALEHFDMSDVTTALDAGGPAILSCFHYTGYPLVALGLAVSPVAVLISKARVDVIEQSGSAELADHVVYLSDRSAAIRMTRALRQGRSVWVLLDVVLPSVRVVRAQFLGGEMAVGAGMGKIARLSDRPCIPVFWTFNDRRTHLRTGPWVVPADQTDDTFCQEFVDHQGAFVGSQPTEWLEWYSVLDEAPQVRAQVKRGNEAMWARLTQALRDRHEWGTER